MKTLKLLLLFVCAGAMVWLPPVAAQDPDAGEALANCLSLNRIKSVDILDERHLVFHMISGEHYLNVLPNRCPGLRKHSALMYRTSLSKLCDMDIVTVLDNIGPGYQPAGACGLGKFLPVQEDKLDALKTRIKTD